MAQLCPSCKAETESLVFMESGEEFTTRKCTKCSWYGDNTLEG